MSFEKLIGIWSIGVAFLFPMRLFFYYKLCSPLERMISGGAGLWRLLMRSILWPITIWQNFYRIFLRGVL